jgi:outer membrane biosynthesis protein TonB
MEPLVWAFVVSACLHLMAYGGYELGKRMGWWERDLLPPWLRKVAQILMMEPKAPPKTPATVRQQIPLMFVEVDPATASKEAPANAKYYSAQNSKASNPDTLLDTTSPKFTGIQTHVPKVETTPHNKPMPLQPAPEKPKATDDKESKPTSKSSPKVGDLAMAKPIAKPPDESKPDPKPDPDAASAIETHKRPRTLAEAAAQKMIPGEIMKQDGGVKTKNTVSTLDAIGSPFGEYDRELINAIQTRWDSLILDQRLSPDHPGEVMLQFRLHYDGRVTDMKVIETTVSEILTFQCQRAVLDPAPYRAWPIELRRVMEADYRDVLFTFFYTYD